MNLTNRTQSPQTLPRESTRLVTPPPPRFRFAVFAALFAIVVAAAFYIHRVAGRRAAAEAGPFWVQLLGTSSAEKADALAKKLKVDGFRPDVSVVPGKKGLFRVRIGPYPDRTQAEAEMKKALALEKLDSKPFISTGK
mgnify:CR=1 FL=1